MARKIHARLKIKGRLLTETPLHIGGFGADPDTDLPLARNGRDELYVPGTSLAGVLRSWCEKNFGEALTKELFGPKPSRENANGFASFVLIEDAKVTLPANLPVEVRDGVGIDRFTGTAVDRAKYDRAVLPRGTALNFAMTVEIKKADETAKIQTVFGYMLAALQQTKIRFGAARTRGLGRVRLEIESIKNQEMIGFENILKLVKDEGNALSVSGLIQADASIKPAEPPRLEIVIHWKPRLPVMVKAGYDGIGMDMLPLASGVSDGRLALVLPGSSIKGALRSQAERIVRTVLDDDEIGESFHEQIEVPLIESLFGTRNKSRQTEDSSDHSPATGASAVGTDYSIKPGLGALAVDDCYAEEVMDAYRWREIEITGMSEDGSYAELWQKLDEVQTEKIQVHPTHHVAIDRWTGGAADGALYSVLAPTQVDWSPMCLTLDFGRLPQYPHTQSELSALMLLLLTLRDVAENRLPFGFGTNRGMGEIQVTAIEFTGSGLDRVRLSGSLTATIEGERIKFRSPDLTILMEEWKQWRTENQAK